MLLKELREQVLEIGMRMLEDGVAHGAQGNVSAFDPESGLVAITPSALPYNVLKPEDICVVDLDRKIVESKWRPTSEIALHMIFYKNRPGVNAVVHSHAPYCTVFSVTNESVPMILNEAAMNLNGPIPVARYGRPGSEEVAEITFEAMQPDNVAGIMAHHGLVTVGPNLSVAYDSTLAAEMTARIVIMARSMGKEVITMDPQECAILRDVYLTKYLAKSA